MQILWTGDSYAEISVPGSYKEKLCGLCGNFNSFPQDDMRTRSGHIASSEAVFGNSWKVRGTNNSQFFQTLMVFMMKKKNLIFLENEAHN